MTDKDDVRKGEEIVITPYKGTDDADGRKWKDFMEELTVYLTNKPKRWSDIIHNLQKDVDLQNVQDEGLTTFNDLYKQNASSANRVWSEEYFWKVGHQQMCVDNAKKDVFAFLCKIFDGTCRSEVRKHGWEKVGRNINYFKQEYGITLVQEINEAERKFERCEVLPEKRAMYARDDVCEWIKLVENSQQSLRDDIPAQRRPGHKLLAPAALSKLVCEHVHPSYAEEIQTLRYENFMLDLVGKEHSAIAEAKAKGPAAWEEFAVPWISVRSRLIARYRRNKRLWEAELKDPATSRHAKLLAYGAVIPDGADTAPHQGCWDCGSFEHKRGDSCCPSKGDLEFAPAWLRRKAGKDPNGGSMPAGAKKKRRRTARKGSGNGNGNGSKVCTFWKRGNCKNGKNCQFEHPQDQMGINANEETKARLRKADSSAKSQRFSDKMANVLVAALAKNDAGSDSDGEEPSKKKYKALVLQAVKESNIFMLGFKDEGPLVKVVKDKDGDILMYDATGPNEYGDPQKMDVLLNRGPLLSELQSAFDNCARCSASNVLGDFFRLDTSWEAQNSMTLVGVGGEAKCGGRGVMMLVLKHSQHGTWVLIDPDAIYIKPKEGDAPLRVISANRMESMGLYIQKEMHATEIAKGNEHGSVSHASAPVVVTTLRDIRSTLQVPLDLDRGLTVLKTVARDTRNYRKDKNFDRVISMIKARRHCPIFKVQKLSETLATATHTQPLQLTGKMASATALPIYEAGATSQGHRSRDKGSLGNTDASAGCGAGFGIETEVNKMAQKLTAGTKNKLENQPDKWTRQAKGGTRQMPGSEVQYEPVATTNVAQDPKAVAGVLLKKGSGKSESPPRTISQWFSHLDELQKDLKLTGKAIGKLKSSKGKDTVKAKATDKKTRGKNLKYVARPSTSRMKRSRNGEANRGNNKHVRFGDDGGGGGGGTHTGSNTQQLDFNCAAGSNQSGRCEMTEGEVARAFNLVDADNTSAVFALWCADTPVVAVEGHGVDNTVQHEFETFVSVLVFKTQCDTNNDYSTSLRQQLDVAMEKCEVYVMNVAKLTPKQRALLWHFRLGHMHEDVPIRLSSKDFQGLPRAFGINVHTKLNCDCVFCDKAKFRTLPYSEVPRELKERYPPFFLCSVDGFGGQKSMGAKAQVSEEQDGQGFGCASIGGAVGGYVFHCMGTGACTPMLYSKKSQFPIILKRFILGVYALQWRIRIIRASDSEIVDNGEVEVICADHEIVIQPTSQGTPEELGRAEKAVGDTTRRARAMLLSAPHLPASLWGAAWVYSGVISWLLPKAYNDDMTPYQAIRGRPPNMRELLIGVFGCPCEVRRVPKGGKYKSKHQERTLSMYFVGTDYPSVLVWLASKNKIYRVSKRKVRLHEGAYIVNEPMTVFGLKQRLVLTDESGNDCDEVDSDSIVETVPTVRSLRISEQQDIDQGESPQDWAIHLESNESIECQTDRDFEEVLVRNLRKVLAEPSLQKQLIQACSGKDIGKTKSIQQNDAGANTVVAGTSVGGYGLRVRDPSMPTEWDSNSSSEASAITNCKMIKDSSSKSKNKVQGSSKTPIHEMIKDFKAQLPPLSRVKPGTRVQILTKLFDPPDNPGYYSNGKPESTYGTVRGRDKGGVIKVLWDGDSAQVKSHWSDLNYLPITDDPTRGELVPALVVGFQRGVNRSSINYRMSFGGAPSGFFQAAALALGLVKTEEPYYSISKVEAETVSYCLKAASKVNRPKEWPRSFPECLLNKDWREWLKAVLKEHNGWMEFGAAKEVPRSSRDPKHEIIRIGELYTRKRDGSAKFRPYAFGHHLTEGISFFNTFSGTVTADSIRFFFSLATALCKLVKQADARCAYLQADEQPIPIYCYKPTFWDFVHMPVEDLMMIRRQLLAVFAKGGKSAVRQFAKTANSNDNIILLEKPLYGIPSAGHSWAQTLIRKLTGPVLQFKRSHVDGCCYYRTSVPLTIENGPFERQAFKATTNKQAHATNVRIGVGNEPHRKDAVWAQDYIMLLTWTDDFPYFGTDRMVNWFEQEAAKLMALEFLGECKDFVSIEVIQHADGSKELTHSKYWLALGTKYEDYLGKRKLRVPMKPGVDKLLCEMEVTDEEHEAVANFPYREMCGAIAFPSCHTKMEIRLAVSLCSRHLSKWNGVAINALLDLLSYCVETHDIGLLFTPGIDLHGDNVMYCYADSGFQQPRSQGCRLIKMNGAVISLSSQKHTTVDTSTTAAELTEAYLASNDICGFRNMMEEMGLPLEDATVIYEDNMPCIQLAEGERNLNETSRHLAIRTWKIRERLDMQQVIFEHCRTYDAVADIGTKALPADQFRYLRDSMNGYAAALLHNPDREMPVGCMKYDELVATLKRFANVDADREKKQREKKAAKKRKR